ncbi:MAG: ABC transporter permease [Moraxella sp.]|uniref:ABC transporter permease n=1 Tax=Moraxella sp. TaxID=479 RepID=UPI0026DACBE1|nr:ABC transporter permease [Moraxella sp.]MDO4451064.1 ABC transporter permease [Moraxella sp.]
MLELHGYGNLLWQGTILTIKLGITSLIFGLIFGLIGATAKLSPIWIFKKLADIYTTVVRGIPELLVVFAVYFGGGIFIAYIAKTVFGHTGRIDISSFWAGVAALSFMFGAYATEVFRMAIQEIPKGQWESAQSLGMRPTQTFFRIILPQMWAVALPGLGNLTLVLLKDTALVSLIGLQDLMYFSSRAGQSTQEPFTFFLMAAIIYLCLTVVVTAVISFGEWRANPAKRYAKQLTKQKTGIRA